MNPQSLLKEDSLVIFLFHGVVWNIDYEIRNYNRKHIEADYFREILGGLKKHGYALSMDEVLTYFEKGEHLPGYSFAVTFDDGFENNYSVAAPILKDMSIPATFYITTSFIESNAMSWIDRIEYCIERVRHGQLSLPWHKEPVSFQKREDKIAILEDIRSYVKRSSEISIDDFVSSVFAQCGLEEVNDSDDPLDQKLSWQQVREMERDSGFIIGGHSHRHFNMAFLGERELEEEVDISLQLLSDNAGIIPVHYSYPEGLEFCYSDRVIEVLRKRGIKCCPTAQEGFNRNGDSLFHLKRMPVI